MSLRRFSLFTGIVALALGLAILLFATGLRRYYSGLFFVVMALVMLWRARGARAGEGG